MTSLKSRRDVTRTEIAVFPTAALLFSTRNLTISKGFKFNRWIAFKSIAYGPTFQIFVFGRSRVLVNEDKNTRCDAPFSIGFCTNGIATDPPSFSSASRHFECDRNCLCLRAVPSSYSRRRKRSVQCSERTTLRNWRRSSEVANCECWWCVRQSRAWMLLLWLMESHDANCTSIALPSWKRNWKSEPIFRQWKMSFFWQLSAKKWENYPCSWKHSLYK